MATDLYVRLTYDEYKEFEDQLRRFAELETTHESLDRQYYHKAFRLLLGGITLEVHGPVVKP